MALNVAGQPGKSSVPNIDNWELSESEAKRYVTETIVLVIGEAGKVEAIPDAPYREYVSICPSYLF